MRLVRRPTGLRAGGTYVPILHFTSASYLLPGHSHYSPESIRPSDQIGCPDLDFDPGPGANPSTNSQHPSVSTRSYPVYLELESYHSVS